MAVYFIVETKIENQQEYSLYINKVKPVVEKHGGRYLTRGGKVTPVSGGWNPERIVIIEFPSKLELRRCFLSKEYKDIADLRKNSTTTKAVMVEGAND